MSDLLQKLNDMQLLAVKHTEGAVLVVAGAGSGKTRVLTHRIAYILEQKLATPREIMAITFTNKATQEMQSRLMNMVGNIDGMWVSTIHGMCARILRRYVSYLSGFQPGFTIYSETEKERVLKRILPDIVGDDVSKYLREVKFEISNAKNHAISPEEYPKNAISDSQTLTAKVYPLYQAELLRCNAMDFDDLLTLTLKLLTESKEVLHELQQRFRYIHVDEFQDTNRVQYDIVRLLAGGHGNIFAVGDDDQSIYAFRGAVVEHMYSFQKDFPDVTVYKLEQNYRSSQFILDAANNLIAGNRTRMSKKLWTNNGKGSVIVCKSLSGESAEATFVIGQIRSMVDRGGYDYSDFAILMRMNAMTRAFEQEAMGYGVPYKVYGGFKFYERKEIKDAVAYLQLIVNPFDEEALRRIINVPKRGIGDVALKTLKEYADASHLSLFDMILQADALPGAYAKKFMPFARLMKDLIYESALVQPAEFIKSVIKKVGLDKMYDKTTEEGAEKLANLDEFISSAEEFFKANPNEPLSGYLESVSLMSDVLEETKEDSIVIGTVHSVKGLEFRVVFIVGLDAGVFPVGRAQFNLSELEEERRLMYVAITRAKEKLCLTTVRSRFLYGERRDCTPSEFYQTVSKNSVVLSDPSEPAPVYRQDTTLKPKTFVRGEFTRAEASSDSAKTKSEYISLATPSKGKEQATGNKDISRFKPGTVVVHPRFGSGTVITVSGENATIAFKGVGIKRMALKLAPLTIVE